MTASVVTKRHIINVSTLFSHSLDSYCMDISFSGFERQSDYSATRELLMKDFSCIIVDKVAWENRKGEK